MGNPGEEGHVPQMQLLKALVTATPCEVQRCQSLQGLLPEESGAQEARPRQSSETTGLKETQDEVLIFNPVPRSEATNYTQLFNRCKGEEHVSKPLSQKCTNLSTSEMGGRVTSHRKCVNLALEKSLMLRELLCVLVNKWF